jgi:uncharacterized protein
MPRNPDTSKTIKLIFLFLLFVAAIAGAEIITYYVTLFGGIILHFAILLALIIYSVSIQDETQRNWWLALGLVPLIRIASLVIPVAEFSVIYWYIIISIPIFIGIVTVMRNCNYTLDDVGLTGGKAWIQVLVAILGIGLGIIDYYILKPEAMIDGLSVQTVILPAFILLIATGFIDELVFRGVLQRAARVLGAWGWVGVALVYAILQIGQGSVLHGAFIFIVSLFFGWIIEKTGSIIGVSLSHGLLNIGLYLILPNIWG